jgi:hypothetical protein
MYVFGHIYRHGTPVGAAFNCEAPSQSAQNPQKLGWTALSVLSSPGREKELAMNLAINDACPKCRKPVRFAVIELHPIRSDLAIYNYQCVDCGPVRARIISLKVGTPSEQAVA